MANGYEPPNDHVCAAQSWSLPLSPLHPRTPVAQCASDVPVAPRLFHSNRAPAPRTIKGGPMDSFKYDLNARRGYFTDAELLEPLKAFGASVGNRPFTMREFKASTHCPCYPQLYAIQFGSWRKALERVGIQGARVRRADPAELIDDL